MSEETGKVIRDTLCPKCSARVGASLDVHNVLMHPEPFVPNGESKPKKKRSKR